MSTSSQQNEEEAAADSDRCHTAEVPSVEDGLRESPLGDVASIGGTKEPAAPESHEPDGEQDAAKVASPRVEEPQPACVAREEEQDAKESQEPALAAPGLEDRCPTSPEGAGVLLSIDSHDGTQVISPIVEEPSMEDEETAAVCSMSGFVVRYPPILNHCTTLQAIANSRSQLTDLNSRSQSWTASPRSIPCLPRPSWFQALRKGAPRPERDLGFRTRSSTRCL
eukprot:g26242.t1